MSMDPRYPPGDPGPFIMPSAMPPGVEYMHDERTPEGVYYFRIYGAITGLGYLAMVIFGFVMMFAPAMSASFSPGDMGAVVMGLIYGGLGTLFFIPTVVVLFGSRKPWVHTLGTVLIALGMTQICCIPILIPLLITWMKPETKHWYGAR